MIKPVTALKNAMVNHINTISNFVNIRNNGWKILIHKRFQASDLIPLICESPITAKDKLERVRSSDMARIYRCSIQVNGEPVVLYIKEYLMRSGFDRFKHLIRPSRAMRSFSAGVMLEANHLHTPKIVAVFEKRKGFVCQRSILITQEMGNARSLYTFFDSHWPPVNKSVIHNRRRLVTELGKTIGQMHKAGISHGDLRGGNVFISEADSGWHFYFIDNERTSQYRSLPLRKRIKNLVQLNMLRHAITNVERMRFFKAYSQSASLNRKSSRQIASAVIRRTFRRFGKRSKTRIGLSATSVQNHWDFQCVRIENHRGIFFKQFIKSAEKAELIRRIESSIESSELLKNDISTRVVRCTWDNREIVIKRYNHQGLWHSLRHTLKGSRARKCWAFGHRLNEYGITTAKAIGFLEQRKFGLVWQSYILNEYIDGPDIRNYLNHSNISDSDKEKISRKTQDLLNNLVHFKITHGDPKLSNILVVKEQPVLIDLDSMKRHYFPWTLHFYSARMQSAFKRRLSHIFESK